MKWDYRLQVIVFTELNIQCTGLKVKKHNRKHFDPDPDLEPKEAPAKRAPRVVTSF